MFLLCSSPAFLSDSLKVYNEVLCSLLSTVLNVSVDVSCPSWTQASLPVRLGGLGIRSAEQLAPSCYLSSAAASCCLIHLILSDTDISPSPSHHDDAISLWPNAFPSLSPPIDGRESIQREWDNPQVEATFNHLVLSAPNDVDRARLTAVSASESGAWLQSLPISSLGLCLDDVSVRICIALRLGLPVCAPHSCRHCGAAVDSLGLHGLSCKKGRMRFHRHAAINDVLHRAFSSAGIPSCLEPSCLSRSDGKRPDSLTLVPWERGKPLVWDATVPDSLAHSYQSAALSGSGAVAALAESKKVSKYAHLSPSYTFTPVAIELFGTMGPQSRSFVRSLGQRICLYTGDENAGSYLMQHLSVAVQRGNAALIVDALPSISSF